MGNSQLLTEEILRSGKGSPSSLPQPVGSSLDPVLKNRYQYRAARLTIYKILASLRLSVFALISAQRNYFAAKKPKIPERTK